MKNLIQYTIPEFLASALINGDYSGLNDQEEKELNEFIEQVQKDHGNAYFMLGECSKDSFFTFYNDVNRLGNNCIYLYIME